MKFGVYVKIGRRQGALEWKAQVLTVGVDAPPIDGAANTKLIAVLSDWLGISKSMVHIVKGHTSRHKLLEIDITRERFNQMVETVPQQGTLFE
jgi:uncharacterized protein